MEKTYLNPKQIADQKYCNQLEICQKCNRNYECLKNECENNSVIKNSCQEIKENWKTLPLELTDKNFVSSLCGENNDFYNKNCLAEQNSNLKLRFALAQIPYNIGITDAPSFFGIDSSSFGIIILFIPLLLGFLGGWIAYFFRK
jgi:hypothetical protein